MPIGQNSYASGNNTGNSNYSLTSTVPDWYIDQVTKYTPASSIIDEDGILGTLRIDAVDLNVSVYEGESATILKKGVGHISSTSVWDGNVALAAHNRGASDYFGEIHTLEIGDVIRYSTALGTRKYEVTSVKQIKETDLSGTTPSSDNRITLITCVRDVAELRWQVTAREIT